MKTERLRLASDVLLYIETVRSIGADEAELAFLVTALRDKVQRGAPPEMIQATVNYATDLAARVWITVERHQAALPLEVVASARRLCKELAWIEQDAKASSALPDNPDEATAESTGSAIA